jgi:asparagine synthase (glutamine-hydrolysing)
VLRAAVQNSVDAWASRYRRIVHRLSGGLDSAIVAGCLAHAPSAPKLTYVNMSVDNDLDQSFYFPGMEAKVAAKLRAIARSGDERFYARLVAQRWNTPLLETRRDTSMDLARLRQVPLSVAPTMYFTIMEIDDVEVELVSSHGAEAFFSGQAGDSVLLATMQPLGAMDYAYLHGIDSGLWQHIVASSALSRDSIWSVIGKTVKHGLLRRPYTSPMQLSSLPTLLTQRLTRSLHEKDFESTFARIARLSELPPGKKNHVQGVASAYYTFVFRAGELSDHIDPLNSQPVWETMLRIPTYTALMGGVNRGLARHAFADLLPAEIRRRQTKGTGTHFYQEVVRRNRHLLLERLAGGLLVRDGFLDRDKIVNCLTADEPAVTIPAASLMAYYAAEEWLQRMNNPAASITSETVQPRETAAG